MKRKSVHEPKAKMMSAAEAWEDAQEVAQVLRRNLLRAEPTVGLRIPLSVFLSGLDDLSQEELIILRKRVDERLVA
jgi:hypothetical protein